MHRDEQLAYIVLCVAAVIFFFFVIPAQIQESEIATVSPRLVPQICTVLIFVLSLYKLLTTLRIAQPGFEISLKSYRLLGTAIAIPAVATFLMQWTGFWVGAGLIVAGCMVFTGMRSPVRIGLFSVGLTVVTWFLMDTAGLYIR